MLFSSLWKAGRWYFNVLIFYQTIICHWREKKAKPSLKAELVDRVVRSPIKLNQDKREFLFEFCNFAVRFSVYIVWPFVLGLNNCKPYKTKVMKTHFHARKIYTSFKVRLTGGVLELISRIRRGTENRGVNPRLKIFLQKYFK